jgi:hypothetical protein
MHGDVGDSNDNDHDHHHDDDEDDDDDEDVDVGNSQYIRITIYNHYEDV